MERDAAHDLEIRILELEQQLRDREILPQTQLQTALETAQKDAERCGLHDVSEHLERAASHMRTCSPASSNGSLDPIQPVLTHVRAALDALDLFGSAADGGMSFDESDDFFDDFGDPSNSPESEAPTQDMMEGDAIDSAATVNALVSRFILMDEDSPQEQWADMATDLEAEAERRDQAGEHAHSDAARTLEHLLRWVGEEPRSRFTLGQEHAMALFQIIQNPPGNDAAWIDRAKSVIASARRDLQSGQQTREATAPARPDIKREYLADMSERADGLERLLNTVQPAEADGDLVRRVFREIHTLKGETGMLGLKRVSRFFHDVEHAIEPARTGDYRFTLTSLQALRDLVGMGRSLLSTLDKTAWDEDLIDPLLRELASSSHIGVEDDAAFKPGRVPDGTASAEPADASAASPGSGDTPGAARRSVATDETEMRRVSVDAQDLDQMLAMVDTVTLEAHHLAHSAHTASTGSGEAGHRLLRACESLRQQVSRFRMVGSAPLFERVRRAIHDAARSSGKLLDVVIHENDTFIDRVAFEPLCALLIHLARNAVDHGIELPGLRRKAGKPERGCLRMEARRDDRHVEITMMDDGRGLDVPGLLAKARESGIEPQDVHSSKGLIALMSMAGLSTKENPDELSGRGVGMEIVVEKVRALRGRMDVSTTPGRGTEFKVAFPVELTAVKGVLFRHGTHHFGLPADVVTGAVQIEPEDIHEIRPGNQIATIRGTTVPLVHLAGLVHSGPATIMDHRGLAVLIDHRQRRCAVVVDEMLGIKQVVVRPITGPWSGGDAVTGAAIEGGERVALMLDPGFLLDQASASEATQQQDFRREVETVDIGTNEVGMLSFDVAVRTESQTVIPQTFAINTFKVREFLPMQPLTHIPNMPPGFEGLMTLRNQTIPVLNLTHVMNHPSTWKEVQDIVMICEFSGIVVGLTVYRVHRVAYLSWRDILPPAEYLEQQGINRCVVGSILRKKLLADERERSDQVSLRGDHAGQDTSEEPVLVLDFERIIGEFLQVRHEHPEELANLQMRKAQSRVMLVDDSHIVRQVTSAALRENGIEVLIASNGQEAQEMLSQMACEIQDKNLSPFSLIDLVITDIEMPQLDGYALTRFIKNHPQLGLIPVLLHSSITNATMVNRAGEVRADGFVPKGDPDAFMDQLRKYL